jgi:hypothetical protein
MGTKVAPTYATLTLGYLENILYEKIKPDYSEIVHTNFKNNYYRFLDDILLVYDENCISLETISVLLNNLNVDLKFKCETLGNAVNFLDIRIYKVENRIETDIFYKPTDSKQYLDFYSNHPRHTKRALPYNLSRRICTIVSDKSVRDTRLGEMSLFLKKCHYPQLLIEDGIRKATSMDRSKLLTKSNDVISKQKKTNYCIPFISTYNPNYPNNVNFVKSIFENLQVKASTTKYYKDRSLLLSNRQPANLKHMLTSAKFNPEEQKGVYKCNNTRCKFCDILITGQNFYFRQAGYNFKVKCNINCNILNCIYVMLCNGCQKIYIGETSNFRLRTNLHRDHVNKN